MNTDWIETREEWTHYTKKKEKKNPKNPIFFNSLYGCNEYIHITKTLDTFWDIDRVDFEGLVHRSFFAKTGTQVNQCKFTVRSEQDIVVVAISTKNKKIDPQVDNEKYTR